MNEIRALDARPLGSDLARTLTTLVAWLFVSVWLGLNGALGARGTPPIGLGLAIVLPFVLFTVDGRFGHPLLGGLLRLKLETLVAFQTFRVLGLVFIVAWAGGSLPGGFALPAGIGDIAVGASAPFVAAAVAGRRRSTRALVAWWNAFGVLDLCLAVSAGVLHSRSSFGLLAGSVTTDAVARYPLSIIPTFFVPLALLLHFQTFRALRAATEAPQSTVVPSA
jgi:hypothetical protein